MLHKPDYVFDSIADISCDFLESNGIKALILDLDNTLTTHNNPIPKPEIKAWLDDMKSIGLPMMIVSNNHYERVRPFAEALGLPFVPDGRKPLTYGYKEAIKRLGFDKSNVAAVGDQIFTDVWGCKLTGIRSIFTYPIEYETGFWFRVKRTLEKPLLPKRKER